MGWAVYSGWGPKLAAHPRAGDRRLPGVRGGCTTGPGGRAPLQTLLVSAQTAGGLSSEVLQSKKRRCPTLTSRVARGWGRWRGRFVGGWIERERETKGAGRPFFSQCAELVGASTPSPGRKHTWGPQWCLRRNAPRLLSAQVSVFPCHVWIERADLRIKQSCPSTALPNPTGGAVFGSCQSHLLRLSISSGHTPCVSDRVHGAENGAGPPGGRLE